MEELPIHVAPRFTEESREDALFHYTGADGLLGILRHKEIWSTAYYCANDVSELAAGKNVLTPLFQSKTYQMIKEVDPRVNTFGNRGVDIREYADKFEQMIFSAALNFFCVYISCFCKPSSKEDFLHGLLSQWRGYGEDGGYALQFSRKKLEERISQMNKTLGVNYELQDVYYTPKNPLKDKVSGYGDAFISSYLEHLDKFAAPLFKIKSIRNPLANLTGGPLESLLDYIIHTKSGHFSEEKECRLSVLEPVSSKLGVLPVDYFKRNGIIVPFTRTPQGFNILECIDWIIVGPGQRIGNRFKSVSQMVRKMGLDIKVRLSYIPFAHT